MLAKGRRNIGESRAAAAIREVREETGYPCRLLPVRMSTRAPAAEDRADVKDEARWVEGLCEPFMVSVRELGEGKGVKFIWWFVAVLIEDGAVGEMKGEEAFRAEFVEREEAVERLTFETDKEVLRGAIALLEVRRNFVSFCDIRMGVQCSRLTHLHRAKLTDFVALLNRLQSRRCVSLPLLYNF